MTDDAMDIVCAAVEQFGYTTATMQALTDVLSIEAEDRYIDELDVLDSEKTAALAWVYCEECDDVAPAYDMIRMDDGAWFCPTCFWRRKNEGNYFGRMMR